MNDATNKGRAMRGRAALIAYAEANVPWDFDSHSDQEDVIADIITDLLHYAGQANLVPAIIAARAVRSYKAEVYDDGTN